MIPSLLIALLAAVPAADAPKADSEKIQGAWDVARIELNGKVQPRNPLFRIKVTFDGDKLFTSVGRRPPEPRGTFKIDQGRTPKTYDVTTPEGKTSPGIYELDGDTLKVCLGAPGDERPATFETAPDDGRTVIVYRREKTREGR